MTMLKLADGSVHNVINTPEQLAQTMNGSMQGDTFVVGNQNPDQTYWNYAGMSNIPGAGSGGTSGAIGASGSSFSGSVGGTGQNLPQGYQKLTNDVLSGIQGTQQAAQQQITDQYAAAQGAAKQSAINRGLGNSTVLDSLSRGLTLDQQKAQIQLQNSMAQMVANYRSQIGLSGLGQQFSASGMNMGGLGNRVTNLTGSGNPYGLPGNAPMYGGGSAYGMPSVMAGPQASRTILPGQSQGGGMSFMPQMGGGGGAMSPTGMSSGVHVAGQGGAGGMGDAASLYGGMYTPKTSSYQNIPVGSLASSLGGLGLNTPGSALNNFYNGIAGMPGALAGMGRAALGSLGGMDAGRSGYVPGIGSAAGAANGTGGIGSDQSISGMDNEQWQNEVNGGMDTGGYQPVTGGRTGGGLMNDNGNIAQAGEYYGLGAGLLAGAMGGGDPLSGYANLGTNNWLPGSGALSYGSQSQAPNLNGYAGNDALSNYGVEGTGNDYGDYGVGSLAGGTNATAMNTWGTGLGYNPVNYPDYLSQSMMGSDYSDGTSEYGDYAFDGGE